MTTAAASAASVAPTRIALTDVVAALDSELHTTEIPDYSGAHNGLQVANRGGVSRVAVAVDASLNTLRDAVAQQANLLIVHHGLFWGGVQPVTGVVYERQRLLFEHDLAIYSTHLPLDCHPALGNNVRLAVALGLSPSGSFAQHKTISIGVRGEDDIDTADLAQRARVFAGGYGGTVRTSLPVEGRRTRRWGLCTGGGANSDTLREAREHGLDTLIVGEGPHHTAVEAIEHDLCIMYAGYYATETLGVQALGAWLEQRYALPWSFLFHPTGL